MSWIGNACFPGLSRELCKHLAPVPLLIFNHQANRGGTILAFQSTLPRIGPGALTLPSPTSGSSAVFSADKEQAVYIPANGTWPEIGQEMVEEGVGLCLWLAGQSEIGVASVGELLDWGLDIYQRWIQSILWRFHTSLFTPSVGNTDAFGCF
jgi:hypothetical protein